MSKLTFPTKEEQNIYRTIISKGLKTCGHSGGVGEGRRLIERYPLYFGGRYPPGERCPGSCVLGEARSAPRWVLSRLKFLFTLEIN